MQVRKGTTEGLEYTESIVLLSNNVIGSVIRGIHVSAIGGVFIASPASTYKYDTITKVRIDFADSTSVNIELQDVDNQPTWNLGTQASLDAAISDLNDFIRT